MSDAIEAAAADVAHVMELWSDYTPMDLARVAIESYRDSEIEALRAKLADCQAVIRSRGHDADCPARLCDECGQLSGYAQHRPSYSIYADEHLFQPGPCSDVCGHDRITGETASDTCEWYDDGGDMWVSGCGVVYTFNDGGPVENDHAFCIKCGKRVSVLGDETTGEKA